LEWIYRKDPSLSNGEDAVYIDNLEIPVYRAPEPTAIALQMVPQPAGITVKLQGEPGRRYVVEVSSNLQQWTEVSQVTARADGSVSYDDPQAPIATARYYRARAI